MNRFVYNDKHVQILRHLFHNEKVTMRHINKLQLFQYTFLVGEVFPHWKEQGYIDISKSDDDKRIQMISLTSKGRAVTKKFLELDDIVRHWENYKQRW